MNLGSAYNISNKERAKTLKLAINKIALKFNKKHDVNILKIQEKVNQYLSSKSSKLIAKANSSLTRSKELSETLTSYKNKDKVPDDFIKKFYIKLDAYSTFMNKNIHVSGSR